METIEERAIKYQRALASSFLGMPDLLDGAYEGYVQGATEQKAIDDAELAEVKRQRDEYYDELSKLRQQKVIDIDKAWKWVEDACSKHPITADELSILKQSFIHTMEE